MEVLYEGPYLPTSPVASATDSSIYFACQASGLVLKLAKDEQMEYQVSVLLESNGTPTGIEIDPSSEDIFLCDQSRQAVFKSEDDGEVKQVIAFIEQFEGRQLRGPNRICFDQQGELIFTDSGAFGDTHLGNAKGSVYRTVHNRQQVVPIASGSMAAPTGVAVTPNGLVYVAELHANRIVRFAQRPEGVYHGSVFAQFSGGVGPMAIAVHPGTGDVFVAKFEFSSLAAEGTIVVLGSTGEEKQHLTIPGPEVSGLAFSADGKYLYVTEQSQKRLYRVTLP